MNVKHWNGNIACALNIKTNGEDPDLHEIIKMCCVVVSKGYKQDKTILPFHMFITSKNQGSLSIAEFQYCQQYGVEKDKLASYFFHWLEKLNLSDGKKILVLAEDWPTKRPFLIRLFGQDLFDLIFDVQYRDPLPLANFFNDKAGLQNWDFPYPKVTLKGLNNKLEIPNVSNDLLLETIKLIECYHRLLHAIN